MNIYLESHIAYDLGDFRFYSKIFDCLTSHGNLLNGDLVEGVFLPEKGKKHRGDKPFDALGARGPELLKRADVFVAEVTRCHPDLDSRISSVVSKNASLKRAQKSVLCLHRDIEGSYGLPKEIGAPGVHLVRYTGVRDVKAKINDFFELLRAPVAS